ncbi:hypothetical protein HPB49_019619 [Dermacentor silvarum]|uniref:Uncharacterized protein n=1 Tax=Dermacentor silvarum TaxID=543639 RepID=A0ACB8DFI4_DERSI|nr:hypothetical protein HPB49_019619 [Dermacentor silvarum]
MSYTHDERNGPSDWDPEKRQDQEYDGPPGMEPDGIIESNWEEIIDNFDDMNLREELLRGIYAYGFEKPSAIQQRAIIPCIKGMDVIAQAQSGTGKTATFSIAILQQIDTSLKECQALILAPTRELAQQIQKVVIALGDYMSAQCHACIGGTNVREDIRKLEKGVHVVVGTPGRVFDMISRKALRTNNIRIFVLDEADEMLSRGFKDQIYDVFRTLNSNIQVILLSATMPSDVLDVTKCFMRNPIRILVKKEELTLEGIKQFYVAVDREAGWSARPNFQSAPGDSANRSLSADGVGDTESRSSSAHSANRRGSSFFPWLQAQLLSVGASQTPDKLASAAAAVDPSRSSTLPGGRRALKWLANDFFRFFPNLFREWNFRAEPGLARAVVHGDMGQKERDVIMREFRSGSSRVLITTDLLARGIDVQQVSLVINFDLPTNRENYIHSDTRGRKKPTNSNFFSLPKTVENQCERTKALSTKRRSLARIKRANLDIENRNLRVCGAHFIAGKPAKLFQETDPDWAPSFLLGYSAMNTDRSRHQRLEKRRAEKRQANAEKRGAELQERRAEADATAIGPCAERPLSPHPTGETDAAESEERQNQRDTAADALRLCTTS